jgi:hypothetical protein
MFHWTTAGHVPYSVLELHHAKIRKSASQHEESCQVAPVELFQENYSIIEYIVCQVPDRNLSLMLTAQMLKLKCFDTHICK